MAAYSWKYCVFGLMSWLLFLYVWNICHDCYHTESFFDCYDTYVSYYAWSFQSSRQFISVNDMGYETEFVDIQQAKDKLLLVYKKSKSVGRQETIDRLQFKKGMWYNFGKILL